MPLPDGIARHGLAVVSDQLSYAIITIGLRRAQGHYDTLRMFEVWSSQLFKHVEGAVYRYERPYRFVHSADIIAASADSVSSYALEVGLEVCQERVHPEAKKKANSCAALNGACADLVEEDARLVVGAGVGIDIMVELSEGIEVLLGHVGSAHGFRDPVS